MIKVLFNVDGDSRNIFAIDYFLNRGKYDDGRRMWYLYLNFRVWTKTMSILFDFSGRLKDL